jgi:hypothetical protein
MRAASCAARSLACSASERTPAPAVSYFTGQLDGYGALNAAGHATIDRESALALFAKEL